MADILPRELDPAEAVPAETALIIDDGVNVRKATPAQLAEAGRPTASQVEALSGADNQKAMTPLRTKQAIEARAIALPEGEANTPLPPANDRVGGKALGFNSVTGEVEVFDKSALVDNTYTTLEGLKGASTDANRVNLVGAPGIADGSFNWTPGNFTGQADDQNIIKADSTALSVGAWVRQGAESIRLTYGNVADAIKFVTPQMFGAQADGTTDDTAAFQAAIDSGLPVQVPLGEYKITDTLLIDPGTIITGAGGTANYDASPAKIRFEPATKRGVFRWRTEPTEHVFAGVQISGFCLRGFGPGAGMVLDLPWLVNGNINFFCYAGIDGWVRLRRWIDCRVKGGVQGFRNFGVEFSGEGDDPADVSTTTVFDAYVAQGPVAYIATARAVTDCFIDGTIESVDNACDIARGNVLVFNVYTENVPRTDAGSAWVYGKTGTAPASETALTVNLQPGVGHAGNTLNNANAFDVDHVRLLKISGYTYLYKTLLKTTVNTQNVLITGLDTDNIESFSTANGIADFSKITMLGFSPRSMVMEPGGEFFIDGAARLPTLEFAPRSRAGVIPGQIFADQQAGGRLRYRNPDYTLSDPIVPITGVETSPGVWQVERGICLPGDQVRNLNVGLGEVAAWQSMRHSRDTPLIIPSGFTFNGSPLVANVAGAYDDIEIGSTVKVSVGFPSSSTYYTVIDKNPDGSDITLSVNATSDQSGIATVTTASHDLVPVSQQGFRSYGADPVGEVVPKYLGETLFRTDTANWYKSTGLTVADWKPIT